MAEELTTSLQPQDVLDEDEELEAIDAAEAEAEAGELVVPAEPPPPLGRSWAFDFSSGQFVPARAGAPTPTYGLATLRGWIEKCLRTRRGAHPVHDDDYGVDIPDEIWGGNLDHDALGDLAQDVEDALLQHPRIMRVVGFRLEGYDDEEEGALEVSFTVILDDESEVALQGVDLGGF
jgi:hypothetical protein